MIITYLADTNLTNKKSEITLPKKIKAFFFLLSPAHV